MKRFFYISGVSLAFLLSGCYDGDYILQDRMVRDLTTLPVSYDTSDGRIKLNGKSSGPADYLYFEISSSNTFTSEDRRTIKATVEYDYDHVVRDVYAYMTNWFAPGTYYYRLYGESGEFTVASSNYESFTFENPISTSDATEVIERAAVLNACVKGKAFGPAYFLLSKNEDFEQAKKLNTPYSNYKPTDDGREYYLSVNGLEPSTRYFVKFCMEFDGILIEGNSVSFTTKEIEAKPLSISHIAGENLFGQRITDDLMIVIQSNSDWYGPYYAIFDENSGNYVWKGNTDFMLLPDTWCKVYASTGEPRWSNGFLIFGDGDYQYGNNQVAVYSGVTEVSWSDPSIHMNLSARTALVTVAYPLEWGLISGVWIKTTGNNDNIPGSTFAIESFKPEYYTHEYYGHSNYEISQDNGKYYYKFAIFPCALNSKYNQILLPTSSGETVLSCPDMKIQAGESYLINYDGMEITDVTVRPWNPREEGNVTIFPNF